LDASERLVGQLCADFGAPGGESAAVITQPFRRADCEDEVVMVGVSGEDVDESLVEVWRVVDVVA
jgi:hypothetical protein